jgi:BMFP domain-containing protein YqiC
VIVAPQIGVFAGSRDRFRAFIRVGAFTVVNEKLVDEISARIKDVMSRTPAADIERNMRATLAAWFARLDLVTREEFDVQSAVLARTREKLTALEARLAEIEKSAKSQ